MWLVWLGVVLVGLKLADVSPIAGLSWWWMALPFGLAVVWFEIQERFGLVRKKAMDELEQSKRTRIRDTWIDRGKRRPRK